MRREHSLPESKDDQLGRHTLSKIIFWSLFSLIFWHPSVSVADNRLLPFVSDSHQLSFNYDPSLTQESVELPAAIVALRAPQGGFPSFNILASAEDYSPSSMSENAYRDKIINDYRAVGITDAHSVRTYRSAVAGLEVYTTELRYKFREQSLIAAVTLIPSGRGKQLIMTYIDLADQFYRRKVIREDIVNSLKLQASGSGDSLASAQTSPEAPFGHWAMVLTLLGAVLVVVVGCIIFKRRASSGTP